MPGARFTLLTVAPAISLFAPAFRVLVFSKTTGFRHDSIPAGITSSARTTRERTR